MKRSILLLIILLFSTILVGFSNVEAVNIISLNPDTSLVGSLVYLDGEIDTLGGEYQIGFDIDNNGGINWISETIKTGNAPAGSYAVTDFFTVPYACCGSPTGISHIVRLRDKATSIVSAQALLKVITIPSLLISTESIDDDSSQPSLGVGSDGTVHIAWEDTTDYAGSGSDRDIFYKKYVAGSGWTTTEVVSTESTDRSYRPSLAVGSDGTVHIAWYDYTDYGGSGTNTDIFYKKYVPGSGWTTTEIVSTESTASAYWPSLGVDSDGTLHIAWEDYTNYGIDGNDMDICYKKYVLGSGWSITEVVSTESTDVSIWPSLGVGSDGRVHIAWTDYTDFGGSGSDHDIFYKNYVSGAGWTSSTVVSTESTSDSFYPSLAVGSDGRVHIAWSEWSDYGGSGTDKDIFYKTYFPGLGWTSTEVVSTESTSDSDEPSLGVGSDGTIHVAWKDGTDYGCSGFHTDIFYKKYVPGSGWTSTEVVSTESTDYSYAPSLAVGSDIVHIAWKVGTWDFYDVYYKFLDHVAPLGSVMINDGNWYTSSRTVELTLYAYDVGSGVTHMRFSEDCPDSTSWGPWIPYSHIYWYTIENPGYGTKWVDVQFKDAAGNVSPQWTIVDEIELIPYSAYLVVRGSNNRIYYRSYDGLWGDWKVVPSGTTCDTPAATVQNGKLYMVVRSVDGSSLYFGSVNLATDSFSGWSRISGSSPSKPILIRDGDDGLCLVVKGNNNRIYYRYYSCSSDYWNGWLVTPSGITCDTPAAVINGDWLYLAVRGMTGGIYHQEVYIPTEDYSGWYLGSGDTPSTPTLTNYGDDVILVVRGNNNILYYKIWNGGWPAHFTPIPEATTHLQTYGPTAAVIGSQLHIVVLSSAGYIAHSILYLVTEFWEPWSQLSGSTPCGPTLTN